jgi:hypothetical protein
MPMSTLSSVSIWRNLQLIGSKQGAHKGRPYK